MRIRTIIVGLLFVNLLTLQAQKSPLYEKYKNKYPNAHLVRLLDEIKVDIELEGDEIVISQHIVEDNLYLSPSATFGSKKSIDFSSFFELGAVKASSLLYKNGKYQESPVTNFIENDELSDSFYDDGKSVNFIYPNLEEGARSTLEYSQKIKNPRFLNAFYFGNTSPVAKIKYTISVDDAISIRFKEFNTDSLSINFKESSKRGKKIYVWETDEVAAYDLDNDTPNFRNTFPHIIPMLTDYTVKGEKIQLSNSVADLYSWYYSLVENVNKEAPSPELKKVVDELIKDKDSDLEKVRSIYYWAQENIKYIAFEYALGGFIPREANDVFQKKYGDCKDNSSILYEMLKIAGLKGNLTWIGTRSIPYTYTEVPTPAVDNHMILSYIDKDTVYYLDATGRYTPIDMPSSFIQGKEALVGISKGEYAIKKVPVVVPERNKAIDSVYLKIEDKNIVGKGIFTLKGYPKTDLFHVLEKLTKEKDLKELYTYQLNKGSNRFLIDSFKEYNKFDYDKDFKVEYAFNIKEYIKGYEDELYVNLNLDKHLDNFKTSDNRKTGKEYQYKNYNEIISVLEIPESMTATYVPEDFSISNEFFECSIQYIKQNNTITHKLTVVQKFLELTLSQQKELNSMIKKVEKNYKEVVILKKI